MGLRTAVPFVTVPLLPKRLLISKLRDVVGVDSLTMASSCFADASVASEAKNAALDIILPILFGQRTFLTPDPPYGFQYSRTFSG